MPEIIVRTQGVKKATKSFKPVEAISEYIWNGFDAEASIINISFDFLKETKRVEKLMIQDNGTGIDHDKLASKFAPFLESNKSEQKKNASPTIKGENGYGRFTFHKFCTNAKWLTTYQKNDELYSYEININSDKLINYEASSPIKSKSLQSGTNVSFPNPTEGVTEHFIHSELLPFLKVEFSWFLELYRKRDYSISVQGENLDYSEIILNKEEFQISIVSKKFPSDFQFSCRFVQWKQKLNDEYSCFYFQDSQFNTVLKKTTKFNNKGDNFSHSVFIQSDFFDFFLKDRLNRKNVLSKINKSIYKEIFDELEIRLNLILKEKRKPILKENAEKLIYQYEKEGIMPEVGSNEWDKLKRNQLNELIIELYEVEPKIFFKLNEFQKKIFIRFLNLLLDNDTREDLFEILSEVVELNNNERKRISEILKVTKLTSIIETIELIRDRVIIIDRLKDLVFDKTLEAKEVPHLQNFVEQHFWVFGEEYRLVAAAENKFDTALRNFRVLIDEKYDKNEKIEHKSRLKEMDIFLVRQSHTNNTIDNLVVELKHPSKTLGKKELDQVKEYMSVIASEPRFNANNYTWKFYLIGKKYSSHIEDELENKKTYGEKDLVFSNSKNNYKIYIKKWSDIINDIELRHNFLNEKLSIEREKLHKNFSSIDDLMIDVENSSAKQK